MRPLFQHPSLLRRHAVALITAALAVSSCGGSATPELDASSALDTGAPVVDVRPAVDSSSQEDVAMPNDLGAACSPPRRVCPDGACVDLNTDLANCGGCGQTCAPANATGTCVSGVCAVMSCLDGFRDCDGNPSNGCEVDTRTNATNCGSCGTTCATANGTPACVAGVCAVQACNAGYGNCDGQAANGCETELNTSALHCGRCGSPCSGGQVCSTGVCQTQCAAPTTRCGDGCFNLAEDENHCGSCTNACRADQACVGGTCTCPAGQTVCGGTCQPVGASCVSTGSGGCEQPGTIACIGTATRCDAAPRTSGSCTGLNGGVCNTSGQCACPTGQTNCGGVCRTIGTACTSPGSGGCEQRGVTVCDGTSTRCNAAARTSGPCSNPMAGQCDGAGACVCPAGQSNCSGWCRATGASCTSAGTGGCQQSGTVVCRGTETACSASPRTSGSCSAPSGGTCTSSGVCACPSGTLTCGSSCQAMGSCTSAGSGGCEQTGSYVCSGSTRVCSATGPRTSGRCPTSTSARVCNSAGNCVCPPSAPAGWSFVRDNCGAIRSNLSSGQYAHCCGAFCGQPDPWLNTWSPPACPSGYRYRGCGIEHLSGGGRETVSGCTLSQFCVGLEGSTARLYALCDLI